MNRQLSENDALFRLIRLFVAQYLATVHNYKSCQNEAVNIISSFLFQTMKKLVVQTKRLQLMQGRTEPNCLVLLVALKQLGNLDLKGLSTFLLDKRYILSDAGIFCHILSSSKSYQFPHIFFEKTISKVFENDHELINKYEKDRELPTIRIIKSPYLFKFSEDSECLPYRTTIDEAFPKPSEFTYKNTVQKIYRQKKNNESLVAYTRKENRKALGLYLDAQETKPRKKINAGIEVEEPLAEPIQSQAKKSANNSDQKTDSEFDYINFL